MFYEVFKIGPFTIHGYGLMIAIGLLCAILLANYRAKRKGFDQDLVFNIIIIAIIFGFAGAKLLYLIVEFKAFLADPWGQLGGSGFAVYGGIIVGALAAFIYCRKKKISFLKHFDLFMPSVALAQGFGRVGCLGAGCCFGKETESLIHIIFHDPLSLAPLNTPLIPTQIYSSLANFAIAGILLLFARKDRRAGNVGLLYMALYSVFRFTIEFFRADHRGTVWGMSTSQFISIFVIVAAVTAFIINWKKGLKDTDKEKKAEDKEDKKEA